MLASTLSIKFILSKNNYHEQKQPRLLSSFLTTIFLLLFIISIPSFLAFLFGMPSYITIKFILYTLIYHGLNGFLFLSLLKQNPSENMKIPFILMSGICFNIVTIFILSFFHLQIYSYLNIFILLFLSLFTKIPLMKLNGLGREKLLKELPYITLLTIPLFIGGAAYVLQHTVNQHFLFQGAISSTLANYPYPYPNFLFSEVPFFYNYAYHFEMAFCSLFTAIDLEDLSSRLYPLYILFLLIHVVYSFCREFIKGKEISGLLVLFNTFCVVGFNSQSLEWLILGLPASITLTGSSMLGLAIFFLSVHQIYKINNQKYGSFLNYLFLFFLIFIGSISRSAFPIILGGGIFFLTVTEFLRTQQISSIKNLLIVAFLLGIAFVLALVSVYGIFSPYTATGFLRVVPQNMNFLFSTKLIAWIQNFAPWSSSAYPYLSYRFATVIYLIISSGILFIGFYYQIFKWIKNGINNLELLLIFCALTGVLMWNFTEAPGGSHFTFYHYSLVIFSIFGASGTYLIFKNTTLLKNKFLFLLSGLTVILLILRGKETYDELKNPRNWNGLFLKKLPHYSNITNNLTDKFKHTLTTLKKEDIIVMLLSSSKNLNNLQTHHVLFINSQGHSVYTYAGISYLSPNMVAQKKSRERLENIKNYILLGSNAKTFDNNLLNLFKSLFPNKGILFLVDKEKNIKSNELKIVEELEDMKLIKYSM